MSEKSPWRDRRVELELSIEAVAARAGLSARTVHRTEHGRSLPTERTIRRLAKALDLDPDEYLMAEATEAGAA